MLCEEIVKPMRPIAQEKNARSCGFQLLAVHPRTKIAIHLLEFVLAASPLDELAPACTAMQANRLI
jgi:hypothetical protein